MVFEWGMTKKFIIGIFSSLIISFLSFMGYFMVFDYPETKASLKVLDQKVIDSVKKIESEISDLKSGQDKILNYILGRK